MAAAIQREVGVEPELLEGGGGVFTVIADGQTLFSKSETGRFPEHDEVLSQIGS